MGDNTHPHGVSTDRKPTVDGGDVIDDPEDLRQRHPFLRVFGTHAKTRILAVLLDATRPLNPTAIRERAGIHHDTWYEHRDDLLATGLVEEVGHAGNSPLYAMPDPEDDLRVDWLDKVAGWTGAYFRDGKRPTPDVDHDIRGDIPGDPPRDTARDREEDT